MSRPLESLDAEDHPAICPPLRRNHFEEAMSDLTCQIGVIERLTDLTPDQIARLWSATSRLSKAALAKGLPDD